MTAMTSEELEIATGTGRSIRASFWTPANSPTHIIQVFHGLGEHRARYRRFAENAVRRGMAVITHDHLGHGPDAESLGFFANEDGWQLLSDDGLRVLEEAKQRFPDTPAVLLGHSMGSYVAQSFSMQHGDQIQALILSASTWPDRSKLIPGRIIAKVESWRLGRRGKSALLDKLGFGDFNKRFEPARTEMDWLSRDKSEVDAYIDDPLCGGPYSCGLWLDVMHGLLSIASDQSLRRIPTDLPLLMTGGADDPVGGTKGIEKLADHYRASGHEKLDVKIYVGGRHEMLNETNRDEFTGDLLTWIEQRLHV